MKKFSIILLLIPFLFYACEKDVELETEPQNEELNYRIDPTGFNKSLAKQSLQLQEIQSPFIIQMHEELGLPSWEDRIEYLGEDVQLFYVPLIKEGLNEILGFIEFIDHPGTNGYSFIIKSKQVLLDNLSVDNVLALSAIMYISFDYELFQNPNQILATYLLENHHYNFKAEEKVELRNYFVEVTTVIANTGNEVGFVSDVTGWVYPLFDPEADFYYNPPGEGYTVITTQIFGECEGGNGSDGADDWDPFNNNGGGGPLYGTQSQIATAILSYVNDKCTATEGNESISTFCEAFFPFLSVEGIISEYLMALIIQEAYQTENALLLHAFLNFLNALDPSQYDQIEDLLEYYFENQADLNGLMDFLKFIDFVLKYDVDIELLVELAFPSNLYGDAFEDHAKQQFYDHLLDNYSLLDFESIETEWLINNPKFSAENKEFLDEEHGSSYGLSAVEIVAGLEANGLADMTLPELQAEEELLEQIINGSFNLHGLQDRSLISNVSWAVIFSTEWKDGPSASIFSYLKSRLKAVKLAIKEGWEELLSPISAYVDDVFSELNISLPSSSEEWYVMAAIMSPILLDLGLDFVPIVGDIKGFADAYTDFANGEYTASGIGLLASLVSILPVGDLIKAIPKVEDAFSIAGDAFKIVRALKNLIDNVFNYVKDKVKDGWNFLWNNNGSRLDVLDATGEKVGEISDDGVPTISKKVFSGIIDPGTFKNLNGKTLTNSNSSNYVSKGFINDNAVKFNVTEPTLKNKFDEIIDEGDQIIPPGWGKRTEGLLKEVLTDSGEYSSFDGSYNSSVEGVNGFDGVFIKGDLTNYDEIIINESKQFTGGGISLNAPGNPPNGISAQMTDDWVRDVCQKLRTQGKIHLGNAIENALDQGKLVKVVTSVDRTGGELIGGINITKID